MKDISKFVLFSCDNQNNICSNKVRKIARDKLLFTYPCESLTECFPYSVHMLPGEYRFDLYGAQGGDARHCNNASLNENSGGKGAHVSGKLIISNPNQIFYFYIGGKGEDQSDEGNISVSRGGYNGGGNGGIDLNPTEYKYPESSAGGGGATDIRLIYSESYDDTESLKSRIAVAAGGGGAVSDSTSRECKFNSNLNNTYLCTDNKVQYDFRGGPGGRLFGYTYNPFTFPPNQTFGNFGRGADGINISTNPGGSIGGSGGGYYGGTCISNLTFRKALEGGGSGGSSYISGYEGCISVRNDTISENKYGLHIHYSNIVFSHPVIHSGLELFEDEYGQNSTGHSNSGSILITCLSDCYFTKTASYNPRIQFFILSFAVMLAK